MLVGSMTPVPVKVGVTSSTAARTSSGEASRTSSLSVKIHPGKSSAVSQLFPAPVASFTYSVVWSVSQCPKVSNRV